MMHFPCPMMSTFALISGVRYVSPRYLTRASQFPHPPLHFPHHLPSPRTVFPFAFHSSYSFLRPSSSVVLAARSSSCCFSPVLSFTLSLFRDISSVMLLWTSTGMNL